MNLKMLLEQRADKANKLKELLEKATLEERTLNEEENKEFEAHEKAISELDDAIEKVQRSQSLINTKPTPREDESASLEEEKRGILEDLRIKFIKLYLLNS